MEDANHNKVVLVDFSLDELMAHIEQSAGILDHLSLFERNALAVFNGFFFKDPLLDDIFKTTFQLTFLFDCHVDPVKLNHEIFRKLEEQLNCD